MGLGLRLSMDNFIRAVGLSEIFKNKRKFNKLLKDICVNPDASVTGQPDKRNRVYFENYKYLGQGFGILVYGYTRIGQNKNGENIKQIRINDWTPFGISDKGIDLSGFFIDKGAGGYYYAYCDEEETGNLFEFRINNVLAASQFQNRTSVKQANPAALSPTGTIILPVVKDEGAIECRNEENRIHRELLQRLRSGENGAEEALNQRAEEIARSVRERLKTEDLLTVFEGYFLPLEEDSGLYSILGDIENLENLENSLTGEKIVKMLLNVTGTKINLYINEKDITGMPMEGMRFMGIAYLQGSVDFTL